MYLVAIQCLNEAFEISEDSLIDPSLVPDLLSLFNGSKTKTSGSESKSKSVIEAAERQKVLGNEFVAAKKPTEAVECYTKAIELDATNAIYFSNRAAAWSMLEEHFKALEDAKMSCELNPMYSKAFNRLGKAHLALGEPEEAKFAFERALQLEPNDLNIKNSLEAANRAISGESEIEKFDPIESSENKSGPGGFDFSSIMNNPQFMSMAQNMMKSGALNDLMKDPRAKDMMSNFMANPEDLMKKFSGGK